MIYDYAVNTTYCFLVELQHTKLVPENVELQPYDEKPPPAPRQIPRKKKKRKTKRKKETTQQYKRSSSKFAAKKVLASLENVGLGVGTLVLHTQRSFLH